MEAVDAAASADLDAIKNAEVDGIREATSSVACSTMAKGQTAKQETRLDRAWFSRNL